MLAMLPRVLLARLPAQLAALQLGLLLRLQRSSRSRRRRQLSARNARAQQWLQLLPHQQRRLLWLRRTLHPHLRVLPAHQLVLLQMLMPVQRAAAAEAAALLVEHRRCHLSSTPSEHDRSQLQLILQLQRAEQVHGRVQGYGQQMPLTPL